MRTQNTTTGAGTTTAAQLRKFLAQHARLENIYQARECSEGHLGCSTRSGGMCSAQAQVDLAESLGVSIEDLD
jgi:hypothetical protein